MTDSLARTFKGRTVLVTGHTGFKGSWLSIWLAELGATVVGYSLDPPTAPSNFAASRVGEHVVDLRGDVRDLDWLQQVITTHTPQVVFHLAAQPLVPRSYAAPKETFDVNVGGTINVLEAIRNAASVKVLVSITTDKVYENQDWVWGYRENDPLGGRDPYSASKAMAELAIASYRQSFFAVDQLQQQGVAIASARAGNVIGGGDFAEFRLVPDCMRALLAADPIPVLNPNYVRPWQHVLEALSGYLWLAVQLLRDGAEFSTAWNFGPLERQGITAQAIAEKCIQLWGSGTWIHSQPGQRATETGLLNLNWDKAATRLQWRPVYTWEDALAETVEWFKEFHAQQSHAQSPDMYAVCSGHIDLYTQRARELGVAWAQ